MAAGALQSTKRALVKVLLALAVFYAVRLEVSRESPDQERPGDATIRGADGATNDILFFAFLSPPLRKLKMAKKYAGKETF